MSSLDTDFKMEQNICDLQNFSENKNSYFTKENLISLNKLRNLSDIKKRMCFMEDWNLVSLKDFYVQVAHLKVQANLKMQIVFKRVCSTIVTNFYYSLSLK